MNTKVYIHELVDIIGQNRARYMHHITANWSPIGQAERNQLCFGIWGTVGSTGQWPQVVNMWEHDGWAAMAANFEHELEHPTLQDPSLATWWAEAANYRSGGFDRLLVPAPWSPTINELLADGVRGAVYAHEIVKVGPRRALELLDLVHDHAIPAYANLGVRLVGAFETAMCEEAECVLLWAFPTWAAWGEFEAAQRRDPAILAWRDRARDLVQAWTRTLMVDAPLSPMRIGRQPSVEDRASWQG
ncbi:MAG TPA: hypothetical protein VF183_14200 [Acidimicrobiales bacterium]